MRRARGRRDGRRLSACRGGPTRWAASRCADGHWALMRNHELDASLFAHGPYRRDTKPPEHAYDPRMRGRRHARRARQAAAGGCAQNLVLVGTSRNCAGGMSPWGWLSCEESVEPRHGYVFLCSIERRARAAAPAHPRLRPLPARSRRDRSRDEHAAYLTEDRGDGCLYRFVPEQPSRAVRRGPAAGAGHPRRPALRPGRRPAAAHELRGALGRRPGRAGEREDALRYAAQERGAARAAARRGHLAPA